MRRSLGMLSVLVAVLTATSAHALVVQLLPSTATPLEGSSFTVQVAVSDFGIGEVTGFGFDVVSTLGAAWVSASVDAGFDDESAIFPDVAGSAFPGASGDPLVLATLTFDALTLGPATIGIASDLDDPSKGLFIFADLPTALDLTQSLAISVQPIPEPHAWVLLGVGLAGVVGWIRRTRSRRPAFA